MIAARGFTRSSIFGKVGARKLRAWHESTLTILAVPSMDPCHAHRSSPFEIMSCGQLEPESAETWWCREPKTNLNLFLIKAHLQEAETWNSEFQKCSWSWWNVKRATSSFKISRKSPWDLWISRRTSWNSETSNFKSQVWFLLEAGPKVLKVKYRK